MDVPPLFYVAPTIYALKDSEFLGNTYIYAEPEITIEDQNEWEKYTNNLNYCSDSYMAAFSHFTY